MLRAKGDRGGPADPRPLLLRRQACMLFASGSPLWLSAGSDMNCIATVIGTQVVSSPRFSCRGIVLLVGFPG